MQQGGGGGGGGPRSQYGLSPEITPPTATAAAALSTAHVLVRQQQQEQLVEAASPISSRPPAAATMGNFEQLLPLSVGEDAGDEADRGGGSGGGNRWPRQETLALLKIRSEMDAAFRDATVKGPLWEGVSRKLEEQGYKRTAKKCKEKFENVHKYYKRTKEGRAGRQDGKYYKFFSELEALQGPPAAATTTTTTTTTLVMPNLVVPPVSGGSIGISNPMPLSSVRIPASVSAMPPQAPFPDLSAATSVRGSPALPPPVAQPPTLPISFSSNSSSSLPGSQDNDDDDEDLDPSNTAGSSRKRKRGSSTRGISSDSRRMMEFFEGLMKQVMQKQEAMQHRFLEAIEKREQDRLIREEAWRRQEIGRLTREQELVAQERAVSSSRDAAIISFLQKITGQTIVLPSPVAINIPPVPPPPPSPPASSPLAPVTTVSTPAPSQQQQLQQHHQHQQQQQQLVRHQQPQNVEVVRHHQLPISSEVVLAVPEQQVPPQEMMGGGGSLEPISSRWPKVEVLALIKLRSGLESRYQDTVPKGPLWEEISAGMQRMGYNRNAKRCKEKWENINKYFKKVKESNKKRPEDAKTCPYFHELDALYRKKMVGSSSGGGSGSSSFLNQNRPEQQQEEENQQGSNVLTIMPKTQSTQATEVENKSGSNADAQASNVGLPASFFGEGSGGAAAKKPEDIVKELMEQQHPQHQQRQAQLIVSDYDKIEEHDHSDIGIDQEGDEDEDEDDYEEELEEESEKMAYKIEFQQRQKAAGPSNGGAGNGAPSFLAMVL